MMKSFLQYVAKDILAKHPEGLSDIAIVFPNKRASLFMNQALYDELGKPLWSPAYITISDLFRRHSEWQVPDQISLVFKLYNTFCEVMGSDEPLDHFYSWGQLLLSDFDDVDKNMADAEKMFINLEAWQELKDFSFLSEKQRESLEKFFGKVLDETEMQRRFNDIWRHLADIYRAYQEKLMEEGYAYEGMLYRQVVEKETIDFQHKHYIFVGFNLLQKVEQRLFSRLRDEGRAEFYWDYDSYYAEKNNEAGKFVTQYMEKFPNELSRQRISRGLVHEDIYHNMDAPKDISYISAPTENIQARYVAEWLRQGDRVKDGARTAIVLGDERLLKTVIHCLPDEVENVNITTGYPLSVSPVSTLVQTLINLQLKGTVKNTDKYLLRHVVKTLRHPYAKYISADCPILATKLASAHTYYPSRKELTNGYDEAMAELFAEMKPDDGRLPLLPWIANILKRVGMGAKDEADPLTQESVFRMYTIVNRLNEIMVPCTPEMGMTYGNIDEKSGKQIVSTLILQRLITQVIQSATIPFHGEPLLGIQVMGVLETRNLDFDHVLLLSCNEGNLPKNVNDTSFIPHSIRAGYELTTVENKVAIYAYYFYSLLQRARDVTFTYNNSTEDGRQSEMSRFMLQLMVEDKGRHDIHRKTLKSGQSATLVQRKAIDKDGATGAILDAIEHLSPSDLNRYLRCQLQFFYYNICQLREEREDNADQIDNVMFGNLFHRAAELIYQDLSDNGKKTLTKDGISSLLANKPRMEQHLNQAFRDELFKVNKPSFDPEYNGLQRINKKVVSFYIERLLTLDKELSPFNILSLEGDFYDKMTFRAQGSDRRIRLGGRIDRIDQLEKNGQAVIRVVDYKTGTPLGALPSCVEDIFNPAYVDSKHTSYYLQAFLYACIVRNGNESQKIINKGRHPVAPALFFIRQASSSNYDPTLKFNVGNKKYEVIDDIDAKYEEFMERLKLLLGEIFNTDIPFTPTEDGNRCACCPYRDICGL